MLGLAIGAYLTGRGIYLAFFHPLAKVPGPKLYVLTDWFYLYYLALGVWPYKLKELHEQYGSTLRFSPNEISTIAPEAWKTIYGHKKETSQQFIKDPDFYDASATPVKDIIHADNDGHKRMRRVMAHAFSEKALRGQADILSHHVDLFIAGISQRAEMGPIDITLWYTFATYDVVGDLAFGQSFGCLKKGIFDPAVASVQNSIKFGTVGQIIVRHPWAAPFFNRFVPRHIVRDFKYNIERGEQIVKDRIDGIVERPERQDLLDLVLRHNDEKGLSRDEIATNATTLIIAGSDTTSSTLAGTTYNILTNQDKYDRLVSEIRERFVSEKDINIGSVNELSYLLAVFDESFRLYPPVPVGLPRVTPLGGSYIDGFFVPENAKVSIPHLTAYKWPESWIDAEKFIPERWLGDPRYANDRRDILHPFSTGSRNCIGKNLAYAEMRLILARLLWRFDLAIRPEGRNWHDQRIYFAWEKGPLMVDVTAVKR